MSSKTAKIFIMFSITVSLFLNTGFSFVSLQSNPTKIHSTVKADFPFKDVKGHPAEAAIVEMHAKGAMRGYTDGTFKPKRPVTFLEAEVMLDKLLWGKPIKSDLTSNEYLHKQFDIPIWAVGYIASALRHNILLYNELQKLSLQQPLTRENAAILVVRAMELTNQVKRKQNSPLPFSDSDKISEEARGYVVIAWEQKIFYGTGGKFQPTDPISRSEMAIVLSRLVQQMPTLQSDEISGFVKLINPLTSTVSLVNSNDEEVQVRIPDQSLYYLNGKPSSFAELAVGNNVRVINTNTGATTVVISQVVAPDTGSPVAAKQVNLSVTASIIQQWAEENKASENHVFKTFDDGIFFLVTRGEKMHSGFSVEITKISTTEDEKGIHYRVWVEKSDPPRGAIVNPRISYPLDLKKIELSSKPIADVTFVNQLNQVVTEISPVTGK